MHTHASFGSRRTYYNNFASHLLNAYNPNMLYPELRYRWDQERWNRCIDMVADFGFNAFEFWLEPRLFCREGLTESYGTTFVDEIRRIIDYAHTKDLTVQMLCSLATSGSDWRTLCPNQPDEWAEAVHLWREWLSRLSDIDVLSLFPGDPGACSLNGCTAETYIDRSCDVAHLAAEIADCEVELGTWGPPFFGWGIIEGPPGWDGSFEQSYQSTAWRFDAERAERSMEHLLARLPDFPDRTSVAINLGFNPDGNPGGPDDATRWVRAVAESRPVYSWDFSLTEGENAITPHRRFERLFERRKEERATGAYSGGICFTMTPLLNQLSLFEGARSFIEPDANPKAVAEEYFTGFFGTAGEEIAALYPVFEIVADWGYYSGDPWPLPEVHRTAKRLGEILRETPISTPPFSFVCDPEEYRDELLFYADLYAGASAWATAGSAGRTESNRATGKRCSDSGDDTETHASLEALKRRFRNHVYAIYDDLPEHVDPRPEMATRRFIDCFTPSGSDS